MARRYGGRFSPEAGSEETEGAHRLSTTATEFRIAPGGARVNLLYLPAAVLAVFSLGGGPERLALGLIGASLWALAAWLTREGLRAEAAWHDRKVARRPAMPRKLSASLLVGIGTAVAAGSGNGDLPGALLYGVIGAALHVTSFGVDPLTDKGIEGVDRFQQDRVARAVDEAEKHLTAMRDAIARTGDRQIEARVERFLATARKLFRTVENDPRDLTSARKFLSVYLMGARDASVKFAEVYARGRDAGARADYLALLDDLEQNFAARTEKLLANDHADMSVEIEVLRDRLKQEGLRADYQQE